MAAIVEAMTEAIIEAIFGFSFDIFLCSFGFSFVFRRTFGFSFYVFLCSIGFFRDQEIDFLIDRFVFQAKSHHWNPKKSPGPLAVWGITENKV